jgi:hypothetical protein
MTNTRQRRQRRRQRKEEGEEKTEEDKGEDLLLRILLLLVLLNLYTYPHALMPGQSIYCFHPSQSCMTVKTEGKLHLEARAKRKGPKRTRETQNTVA